VKTWLHEADRSVQQVHPMDDGRIPLTGVFATRSPDRPTPIGLHRVTVTDIPSPETVTSTLSKRSTAPQSST
jgi:tRNA (Thr-GGU) A37 N-methylase